MTTTKPRPVTPAMRLARLRNLLRVMEVVAKKPKAAYDIGSWGHRYKTRSEMASDRGIPLEDVPACKTVCCTAGWAGNDAWFRERGFKFRDNVESWAKLRVPQAIPRLHVTDDITAWFGLTRGEGRSLFYAGPRAFKRTTATSICTYIRRLIRKYGKVRK